MIFKIPLYAFLKIKIFHIKEKSSDFKTDFYKILMEELIWTLFKHFQKQEKDKTLPDSFYELEILWFQNQMKTLYKKGNYRPVFWMNILVKNFNKILSNQIPPR